MLTAAGSDTTSAGPALAKLCQIYWYPLYNYVRRRGFSPPDAEDLTQEFFARFLEHDWVANADQEKGRFRTFLLSALIEFGTAEFRYLREPADMAAPEQHFDRRWAMTLLETVVARLRAEYDQDGKTDLFAALNPCLVGERTAQPYEELARKLRISVGTVKSAVHRLRQRYRQLLREEIAQTVAEPGEVEEELRYLIAVVAGSASG